MKKLKLKNIILLFGMIASTTWCLAKNSYIADGYSPIAIMKTNVHEAPKDSAIQAFIDGHMLTVVFTENLGQVAVEVTTALGGAVECLSITTPNGLQIYIPNTGDYIITFTLPNGDEYYGEFTVTD